MHSQGKNLEKDEFEALGDWIAGENWALPNPEEYRNDLAQPAFLAVSGVPTSKSTTIEVHQKRDPNGPASEDQWVKAAKMVA